MAVNPMRGEAELEAGSRGTIKLCFDINAMCYAEEHLGKDTDEIIVEVGAKFKNWTPSAPKDARPSVDARLLRALLWAGAQKYHPGTHLIEAGEIISEAGIGPSAGAVLNGFFAFFGAEQEGGDGPNPPKPKPKAKPGSG